MKTKESEKCESLSIHDYRKESTKKIWVEKGTDYAGAFQKIFAAEVKQLYSTMSETKSAFAERTIR